MPPELLGTNEIHIWCVWLEPLLTDEKRWTRLLSDDEHRRAARYLFERHRRGFQARRGLLRTLLAAYLGDVWPEQLRFEYGPQGKPALAPEWTPLQGRPLTFSASDSHGLVLFAMTTGGRVGVDVEFVEPLTERDAMIKRFFSNKEAASIALLPEAEQHAAFFRGWTRKEAVVKAAGAGLSWPLEQVETVETVDWGDVQRHAVSVPENPPYETRWEVQNLAVAEGYIAAVAAEGQVWRPRVCRWPEDALQTLGREVQSAYIT